MYSFNPFDCHDNQIAAATGGSFAVFKTRKGLRWVAISSNNYEDKDREIVSKKALEADVARTTADGLYGPLRWWHVGEPDPLNLKAPWGRGVDLGVCDFAAMDGPFLVESGTFADDTIGEMIAAKAPQLALSIGFFHPRGEPDSDGVFHHIRRFERSLAPAGKVSNPLTALYVPGATEMPMQEQQLKALADLLGDMPAEKVEALISGFTTQATTKAEAAGLRYKAEEPDPTEAMIAKIEAEIAALKAEVEVEEEEDDGGAEAEEEYSGDMPLSAFKEMLKAVMSEVLAPHVAEMKALNARMGMADKMSGMMDEMKAMFGGAVAQKDAQRAARIAELEQQIAGLKAERTEDLPRALKSAADSEATALPDGTKAPADTFKVEKAGSPVYKHPADGIGLWLEGAMAD